MGYRGLLTFQNQLLFCLYSAFSLENQFLLRCGHFKRFFSVCHFFHFFLLNVVRKGVLCNVFISFFFSEDLTSIESFALQCYLFIFGAEKCSIIGGASSSANLCCTFTDCRKMRKTCSMIFCNKLQKGLGYSLKVFVFSHRLVFLRND